MADFIGVAAYQGSTSYTGSVFEPGAIQHGQIKTDQGHVIHWGDAEHRMAAIDADSAAAFSIGGTNATSINIGATGINTVVKGDLTVEGDTIAIDTVNVLVEDNHLYLNQNHVTAAAAETGGLVVNYLPTSTSDTSTTGGFASTTTVATVGAATFSPNDLIQISSADNASNNGLFEVSGHTGGVLTIKSAPAEDFVQSTFVPDTADTSAVITKVNVSVLRAGTDGIWETASGSASGMTFSDLVSGAVSGNNLDEAYDKGGAGAGRTILVTDGAVLLDKSGTTSQFALEIDNDGTGGGVLVSLSNTSEVGSQYAVSYAAGTYTGYPVALSVDPSLATINPTTNMGVVMVGPLAGSTGNDVFGMTVDTTGANYKAAYAVGPASAAIGGLLVDYETTPDTFVAKGFDGEVADQTGYHATFAAGTGGNATASANGGGDGGNVLLSGGYGGSGSDANPSGNGGDVTVSAGHGANDNGGGGSGSGGNLFLNSGTKGTGGVNTPTDGFVSITAGAGTAPTTAGAVNIGGDALDADIDGGVTFDSASFAVQTTGAITLDSAAASNFTVDGASLDIGTSTSGAVTISSAGAFTLSGAAASSIDVDGGDLDISTTTSGDIGLNPAQNAANSFRFVLGDPSSSTTYFWWGSATPATGSAVGSMWMDTSTPALWMLASTGPDTWEKVGTQS